MTLEEFYAAVGGDYEDTLGRMMSESFIRKFVVRFPADPSFANLEQALQTGNREEAFRAAHTIKGLCLNLGFGTLYRSSEALTEALRHEIPENAAELFTAVKTDYEMTMAAISQI